MLENGTSVAYVITTIEHNSSQRGKEHGFRGHGRGKGILGMIKDCSGVISPALCDLSVILLVVEFA